MPQAGPVRGRQTPRSSKNPPGVAAVKGVAVIQPFGPWHRSAQRGVYRFAPPVRRRVYCVQPIVLERSGGWPDLSGRSSPAGDRRPEPAAFRATGSGTGRGFVSGSDGAQDLLYPDVEKEEHGDAEYQVGE